MGDDNALKTHFYIEKVVSINFLMLSNLFRNIVCWKYKWKYWKALEAAMASLNMFAKNVIQYAVERLI